MTCNTFVLETATPAEMLYILTTEMMLHHLYISCNFCPQPLWSWVDRSQVNSKEYLYNSYDMIMDSWEKFKCTGHGAIELGTLKNSPTSFPKKLLGLESRIVSEHELFLKMNIDEYLQLVSHYTMIVYGMSSLSYFNKVKVEQATNIDTNRYSPTNTEPVQDKCMIPNESTQGTPLKRKKVSKLTIKFLSFTLFTICKCEKYDYTTR